MTSIDDINDCLNRKRVAFAGVSRSEKDFSRTLFREFARRGYDPVPVHPSASEIEGRRCFPRVQEIEPPVEWVFIVTPPKQTETVVMDCAAAGIRRVWLYRATGQGAVSKAAVSFCKAKGIRVIDGRCPFLYWPDAAWIHRLHGGIRKAFGRWP